MRGAVILHADCHYGDEYVAMESAMTAAELVECLKRDFNPSDRVIVEAGYGFGTLKADCLGSGVFQTIDERADNVPVTAYVPDSWDDAPCDTGIFGILGRGGAGPEHPEKKVAGPAPAPAQTGWENCGFVPVLVNPGFHGRVVIGEYTLESRTMPNGTEKYRVRDSHGDIHMVYENSPFIGGRPETDSALGWRYTFDGNKYFNA